MTYDWPKFELLCADAALKEFYATWWLHKSEQNFMIKNLLKVKFKNFGLTDHHYTMVVSVW